MDPDDVSRAISAARSVVKALHLETDDARVLQNSNRLAIRLLPCDVLARVAVVGREVAAFEVELAERLEAAGAPAGTLDPRVDARVYVHDGFAVTLWSHYSPTTPELSPDRYADALRRLHVALRSLDDDHRFPAPHCMDRVAEAEQIVTSLDHAPDLAGADRDLLATTLGTLRERITARGAPEQLLHGEPHPGNVLDTSTGPRFIDLETCCRGPVEFDLAHVPEAVSRRYPDIDADLLRDCRQLVLAMVAAWRFQRGDQLPDGAQAGRHLLSALRDGPPWPTLDELFDRLRSDRTTER